MHADVIVQDPSAYVRLALPLMTKHNIPITPPNYAIWYTYVSGENAALKEEIDAIVDNGAIFSEEINDKLVRQFGLEYDSEAMKKFRRELIKLLVAILKEIGEFSGKTDHFQSTLSKSTDLLSRDLSIDDLKTLVDLILKETKSIAAFGKEAQERIQAITSELNAMKQSFEQARVEAATDFLTGLANRSAFEKTLREMAHEADTFHQDLSLLLVDIDHFKRFNDEFGHVVGDEVLKFVSNQMKRQIKGKDFAARFGGEEFAILLPHTNMVGAKVVAENIRGFFSSTNLIASATTKPLGRITVSIGVASYKFLEPAEKFIMRADKALYHAKNSGRDRVSIQSQSTSA